MKSCIYIFLLVTAMYTITASAQSVSDTGIHFYKGSWASLLEAARKQQKLIFVDIYTEWCAPCKAMSKYIFPLKGVGDKYNPAFICYQLDAEKGEGPAISKQFTVTGYPTCLYLTPSGNLLHRTFESSDLRTFNAQADMAMLRSRDTNTLEYMDLEYKNGNHNPEFLRCIITEKTRLKIDNSAELDVYFKSLSRKEQENPEILLFIGRNAASAKTVAWAHLMDHFNMLPPSGQQLLKPRLFDLLTSEAALALQHNRVAEYKRLFQWVNLLGPLTEKQQAHTDRMNLIFFTRTRDVAQLKTTGYRYVGKLYLLRADSIRAEDARQYQKVMHPFLSGEKDSTKIDGFQEEKAYMVNMYSREICSKLYVVAQAFSEVLPPGDSGLADALQWVNKATELMPGVAVQEKLAALLQKRINEHPSTPKPAASILNRRVPG